MNKLRYIVLLLIYFQSQLLLSQEINFEHFSSYDGLSNNLVRDIIQDDEGYLWFATSGGLNRFDGHFFDVYKPKLGDTTSLSESYLFKLFQDKKGFIWVQSTLGNIHRINPKYKTVDNLKELGLIPSEHITDKIILSDWGDIFLTMNTGLLRIYYPENSTQFKTRYYNKDNLLPGNTIHVVLPDENKTVWFGTNNGLIRLSYEDSADNNSSDYKENILLKTEITSAYKEQNFIYFGSATKELFIYDCTKNKFLDDKLLPDSLRGNIEVINANSKGDVLFGTTTGDIGFRKNGEGEFKLFLSKQTSALNPNFISEIIVDTYGLFWMITEKRGVYQFNPSNENFTYFGLNFENRTFLGEPDKQILFEDSNKDLWIGINGGGLFLFNREANSFNQYTNDPNNVNSISSDIVLSVYEDKSKNLWIGTSYGGINKISLQNKAFHQITPVTNPVTGFDNYIRSIITDPLGNTYLGTKAGKIFIYKGKKKIGTIPDDLYNPMNFPATNVYCMFFDNEHNLWVGTKGNGIFILKSLVGYFSNLQHRDIEIVHISRDPSSNNTLSSNNIYSITQDPHGQYWIGTFAGGLNLLTNPFTNPEYKNFNGEAQGNKNIVSRNVRNLFLDNGSNLWIATSEGISILESRYLKSNNKEFINLRPTLRDTANLSGKVIYQVMQTRNNDILAAMLDGGINQLKAEDFEKRNFNWIHHNDQLLSSNVYSIEEDNNGDIWMGTDNGLVRYDITEDKVERFKINNSYLPLTFSESSSSRTARYEMVFGSDMGFVMFHPDSIQNDSTQFPLCFSKIEINGEEINSTNSDILSTAINYENSIELSHTQNNISLYFSVLDYHEPDAIQYSYFLEGYDNDWSRLSRSNYAQYRRIEPGNYTLHVRGTNSSGILMKDIKSLEIKIKPPFWRTKQGHLLIALFVILIVGITLIIIYRQIYIQNKLKVEQEITEKRIDYYTNISNEFKTPLSLILNPAEEIIASYKTSDFAKQKGLQIVKNATYLKRLIDQILDFRKLREGKMQLKVSEIKLSDFFNEIHLLFLPLAKKLNILLSYECNNQDHVGYVDITQLEKITFNLLSNALRFSTPGTTILLKVNISKEAGTMQILIEYQGKGIDEEDLPRLFDKYYMTQGSTGIGLFFTRELVYLHKGEINVEALEKEGARFIINIPISKKSYLTEEIDTSRDYHSVINLNPIDEIETIITENENEAIEHKHTINHIEKIVLLESNQEMRKYLAAELSRKYKVYSASDGQAGFLLITEHIPDLVITDLNLKGVDGLKLIKRIRDNMYLTHIPVFLLSAEASIEHQIKGINSGADDYILKPFNINYLLAKIEKTISRNKTLRNQAMPLSEGEPSANSKTSKADAEFITEVQNLIVENIANQKLNVEFLVDKIGISRTLFFKKLKVSSGLSPNEYIRKERMKQAARLLSTTTMPVSEVGFSVGFSDANYFGKSFRKHFGMTPSKYKEENSKKPII